MLIQFWSWKYWKTIQSNNLGTWNRFTLGVCQCLNLYFGCLNLYPCISGVWTYTLLCMNLYFVVSELILWVPGRTDGRAAGRSGGRVGWLKSIGKESILGTCSWTNRILYISLNTEFGVFFKKDARRKMTKIGPKNAPRSLIWDQFRPEN